MEAEFDSSALLYFVSRLLYLLQYGFTHNIMLNSPSESFNRQFLLEFVQPLAEQAGWCVLYYRFEVSAHEPKMIARNFKTWLLQCLRQMKISSPEAPHSIEPIMTSMTTHSRKVLLLLDGFEGLAQKELDGLFASLRAALDMNKDALQSICLSANQQALKELYSASNQPTFQFG